MEKQKLEGLKAALLDYCANDYECLEDATEEVTRWIEEDGLQVDYDAICVAIVELVEAKFLDVYKLIPAHKPQRAELGEHWATEEGLYFLTTQKGLELLAKAES